MRPSSSWGSLPRFYEEPPSKEVRPGPGAYDFSQYSMFSSGSGVPGYDIPRLKTRSMKRKKKRAVDVKVVPWKANSLDMLSKGVDRNSRDSWGRDLPTDIPGPGTYDVVAPGTFDRVEYDFPPNKAVDRSYILLQSIRKRLNKIEKLKRQEEEIGLETKQKILYKKEIQDRNISKLQAKKEELERLVQHQEDQWKHRCSLIRPASAFASIVSPPGSRISSRREPRKSKTAELPRRNLPEKFHYKLQHHGRNPRSVNHLAPVNETVNGGQSFDGLLSLYDFPSFSQEINPEFMRLQTSMTQTPSRTPTPYKARERVSTVRTDQDREKEREKNIHKDQTISKKQSESLHPVPCAHSIQPRALRKPTFWPDFMDGKTVTEKFSKQILTD